MKKFFKKVGNYIKNTAWIQPLLIVVVIFVILFSLHPLTEAIKKGWTNLTTRNNMEEITFEEYVNKVEAQKNGEEKDFVVVFTQKGCAHCPNFYKAMNEYLKTSYKSAEFKIYNVDLSVKGSKVKLDGTKYTQYKDTSCGLVAPKGNTNAKIQELDYVFKLDERIGEFVNSFGDPATYTDVVANADPELSTYTYVFTPLIVWYQSGYESRVSNTYSSASYLKTDSKGVVRPTAFKEFIQDFGGNTENSKKADSWAEPFDLKYHTGSLKDAYNK